MRIEVYDTKALGDPMEYIDLLFIFLGFLTVLSGLMIILARNLVYSAVYLSILGVLVATLISLLGLPTLGVIHILVYVGAGVLFIVMTTLLLREEFPREVRGLRIPALLVAILSASPLVYISMKTENRIIVLDKPDYVYIAEYLTVNYFIIVMIIASVSALSLFVSLLIAMKRVRK